MTTSRTSRPADHRRGPDRALRRLLRGLPRAERRGRRLAARARRPDHRDVPREGRSSTSPASRPQGPRPGRGAGRAGRDRRADVPPRPHRRHARAATTTASPSASTTAPGRAGAVLITAGIGKFSPRALPAGDGWLGRGLEFFVPSFAPYAGKDVVIVGGGDSAFDWALHLEPMASSVTLVHRRDAFRAHERTVERSAPPRSRSSPRPRSPRSRRRRRRRGGRDHRRRRDRPPARRRPSSPRSGFIADLGPLQHWGIETAKRHIVVDSSMRTNLARVFAAGDITDYPGKVRLIAVGFGEAATAVNNAAVAIDPSRPRVPRPLLGRKR